MRLIKIILLNTILITGYIPNSGSGDCCALAPQICSKPIIDPDIKDKQILKSYIAYKLTENPGFIKDGVYTIDDIFTDFGKTKIAVFLGHPVTIKNEDNGLNGTVITTLVDGKTYYWVQYEKHNIPVTEIFTMPEYSHFSRKCGGIERNLPLLGAGAYDEKHRVFSLDSTDRGVKGVLDFFEILGLNDMRARLSAMLSSGGILLSVSPFFREECMTVKYTGDSRARAAVILNAFLSDKGFMPGLIDGMFDKFWEKYESGKTDEYARDPGTFEERLMKYSLKSADSVITGEDAIRFNRLAVATEIACDDVKNEECSATLEDIRNIFRKTAGIFINRLASGRKQEFTEEELELFSHIAGGGIKTERLSDTITPAARVMPDGEIIINEKFVKLMYKLRKEGKLGPINKMDGGYYEGTDLYTSIIHAVAISVLSGISPSYRHGSVIFEPSEYSASGERGRRYLYLNTLAIMYYWLAVVEKTSFPEARAKNFMRMYPEFFTKLSKKEKDILPAHFKLLCSAKIKEDTHVLPAVINFVRAESISGEDDDFKALKIKKRVIDRVLKPGNGIPVPLEDVLSAERGDAASCGTLRPGFYLDLWYDIFLNSAGGITEEAARVLTSGASPGARLSRHAFHALKESGLIFTPANDSRVLKIRRFASAIETRLRDALKNADSPEDTRKIKPLVYGFTEPFWGAETAGLARETRETPPVIIGIETGWIPETQKLLIKSLLQRVEKLNGGKFHVVFGTSETITGKIISALAEEEGASIRNTAILVNASSLENIKDQFTSYCASRGMENEQPLLAGIDPRNLTDNSYIRLLEMLSLTIRMSRGQDNIPPHPWISIKNKDPRTYIFTPQADPLDLEALKHIYRSQARTLLSA
ncbi:MAG: hypothetical protein ABH883_00555 [Candidatus Omnitrophota bacterium]